MERALDGQSVAALSGAHGSTNILDLNEDCFLAILEYLELWELTVVADVCTRLKQIAQTHFRTSEHKRLTTLEIYGREGMSGVSNVLRNFGAYMVSIDIRFSDWFYRSSSEADVFLIETKIIKLACRYCVGTLQELKCSLIKLEDDVAQMMLPLISQLKSLHLRLRQYGTGHNYSFKFLPKTNKLEELALMLNVDDVCVLYKLLKKSPHLKKIGIAFHKPEDTPYCGHFSIEAVATHCPLIENITLRMVDVRFDSLNKLRQLKLNTVAIEGPERDTLCRAMNEMAEASLQHLKLNDGVWTYIKVPYSEFHYQWGTDSVVNEIAKFKGLKTLVLYKVGLHASHLIEILKNLTGLNELEWLEFDREYMITVEKLLEIVRNGQALQYFYFKLNGVIGEFRIDSDTFSELVNIVKERPQKNHLEVVLDVPDHLGRVKKEMMTIRRRPEHFMNRYWRRYEMPVKERPQRNQSIKVLDVPDDLARANKETLTISRMEKNEFRLRNANRYIKWY